MIEKKVPLDRSGPRSTGRHRLVRRRSPARRRATWVAGLWAILAVITVAGGGPASAHTALVDSDPADGSALTAAPEQVTLTYTEEVDLPPNGIQVLGPGGAQIDIEAGAADEVVTVDLPAALPDGTYVVSWRVLPADGHPLSGSLAFDVQAGASAGEPERVAVDSPDASTPVEVGAPPDTGGPTGDDRATAAVVTTTQVLTYIGIFVSVGLALYVAWILPTALGTTALLRSLRRTLRTGAGLAALAVLGGLPVTLAHQQGLPLAATATAAPWAGLTWQAAGVSLVLLGALALTVASVSVTAAARGATRGLATGGAAVAAVTLASSGHTRSADLLPLLLVADTAHVLAGCIWLGGLVGLVLTLRAAGGHAGGGAQAVSRFSAAAATILVILFASGAGLSWRLVGTWENLFHSTYGLLLLTKLGVVAIAVTLAAWNRYVLLPRSRRQGGSRAARLLLRTVAVEAALLTASLVVTGLLANASPEPATAHSPPTAAADP